MSPEGVPRARENLAHHPPRRAAAGDGQSLLAAGREIHVARPPRRALCGGDRLLAGALHVERRLALALERQHAVVEHAHADHVPGPLARVSSPMSPVRSPPVQPSSSARTIDVGMSLGLSGRESTGGRRTFPAAGRPGPEKSGVSPGRPGGSGTRNLSGCVPGIADLGCACPGGVNVSRPEGPMSSAASAAPRACFLGGTMTQFPRRAAPGEGATPPAA